MISFVVILDETFRKFAINKRIVAQISVTEVV
jgi:hypothetical protein